jgi:hypothetical protein
MTKNKVTLNEKKAETTIKKNYFFDKVDFMKIFLTQVHKKKDTLKKKR